MGIYSDVLFPRALDMVLGQKRQMRERRETLSGAAGEVLEIGFGTGLNLSCFPEGVERLTVIDPSPMMKRKVQARIEAARMPVEKAYLTAESLPFDTDQFDCVVSTWTLCTIPDADRALGEVKRVLKPGGKFLFLEHTRSVDEDVARRQDRWNWFQRIWACGCNLNRPIHEMIERAGFEVSACERFQMPKTPKIMAEHVRGVAVAE